MITEFNVYRSYRSKGFSHQMAWGISGASNAVKKLRNWLLVILFAFAYMYLISDKANAQENTYVAALEKTLATCMQDGLHEVWVGEDQYLCGAYKTGVKK